MGVRARTKTTEFAPLRTVGRVGDPDVQLDVPDLRVEEVDLEVGDLRARVSLRAELADLVKIDVGLDVELGEVKLQLKGVEAQAQLKASLDNVRTIFSEVLASLQHNPQFFRQDLEPTDQTDEAPGGDRRYSRPTLRR